MEKKEVDSIVERYFKKVFGYALTKTKDLDSAEELASLIIYDVYKSLLKKDKCENIDGYVYRVASNVYARFVKGEVKEQLRIMKGLVMPNERFIGTKHDSEEDHERLRKEITYLCKIQREIIVMYCRGENYFIHLGLLFQFN